MAIETRSDFENLCVHLFCKGEFDVKGMEAAFLESFELASQNNLNLILINGIELYGKPPSTLERFNLGEYVADLCWQFKRPIWIALAAHIPIVDHERFGETVARNRGANGKVFTDLEEAKAWLKLI